MSLDRPIIIISVGRSGSTILHQTMCRHRQVSWLNRLNNMYPTKPQYNHFLMCTLDVPVIGKLLYNRVHPGECYPFWFHYYPGFRESFRDLTAEDVTPRVASSLTSILEKVPTSKRPRLLIKITGWPRVGFLKTLFPEARFIHIVRDGRAVVNSMLQVRWWWGWRGPENWRWGPLTEEQYAEWKAHKFSFIALAAIEWKLLMEAYEKACSSLDKEQLYTLKYEDLCVDPLSEFRTITDFCDLTWSPAFARVVKRTKLVNTNYKWKRDLNVDQQEVVNTILEPWLDKLGYK
ncbi:MAG: sulfotransferase [Fidelibacterota bacterium]